MDYSCESLLRRTLTPSTHEEGKKRKKEEFEKCVSNSTLHTCHSPLLSWSRISLSGIYIRFTLA